MKGNRSRNTFNKIRLTLFIRSYAGYSIQSYLRNKYEIYDKLTETHLHKQFHSKKIIPEISRLSRALNLDYKLLCQFIVLNKKRGLNTKIKGDEKVKTYLAIESEIVSLAIARQDQEDIINADYDRSTLSSATERAAGNSLRNIKNDFVFEEQLKELKKEYRHWYYKIAYKYKLPTPRILAFILRLISS